MSEEEETALLIQMKFEGKHILWGDGIHDDTEGMRAFNNEEGNIYWSTGEPVDDSDEYYRNDKPQTELSPLNFNRTFWLPATGYEQSFLDDLSQRYFPGSIINAEVINPLKQ